ncbi:MAG: hypothetical protein IJK26_01965 [Clostridia bacterium]|nr:hypothetical protein [Clostridia bacterium]
MSLTRKRIILVLLIVTILALSVVCCFAEDIETPENEVDIEEFVVINTCDSDLSISGITATCTATLHSKYSTNLSIVMVLQKSTSNGYTDVKSWSKSGTGTNISISESRAINVFSTYRLKVTFTAGNESYTTYAYN